MKRIFLVTIFLLAGIMAYAQQAAQGATLPTSSQTKQTAQQYSSQAKTNSTQFEATLADLIARNTSNKDAETFVRLKNEIDQLESAINAEEVRIRANLDNGKKLSPDVMTRIERLIEQHKAKIQELDAYFAG